MPTSQQHRASTGARSASGPVERAFELGLRACGLATLLTTVGIVVVLARGTWALFADAPAAELFAGRTWAPLSDPPALGVWPLVSGTLLTSAIAIAVALPLGLLAAIYLAEFATPKLRRALEPTLEVVAGIPTIVFGYLALVYVTPALQRVVPGLEQQNALSPGIVMGVMILPMITSLSAAAIRGVPRSLREAAWALGVGELRTLARIVLPAAASGVAAAVVLAISRAIGETMIVTIAAGMRPTSTLDPRVPIETLTAYVIEVAQADVAGESLAFAAMFAVGAGLFVLTFLTNLVAARLARRSREGAA